MTTYYARRSRTSRLAAVAAKDKAPSQEQRVLALVRERGPVSREQIALALHIPLASSCARVAGLLAKGALRETDRLVRTDAGRWAATVVAVEAAPRQGAML